MPGFFDEGNEYSFSTKGPEYLRFFLLVYKHISYSKNWVSYWLDYLEKKAVKAGT